MIAFLFVSCFLKLLLLTAAYCIVPAVFRICNSQFKCLYPAALPCIPCSRYGVVLFWALQIHFWPVSIWVLSRGTGETLWFCFECCYVLYRRRYIVTLPVRTKSYQAHLIQKTTDSVRRPAKIKGHRCRRFSSGSCRDILLLIFGERHPWPRLRYRFLRLQWILFLLKWLYNPPSVR